MAKEIQSNLPSEVSVSYQSPAESMVQALVADQSVLNTLSQAILSAIKQDLPRHATELSRPNIAAAPVDQSAEQSALESVDQTGKVRATKRSLPIDVVVIEENTQAKHPRIDKFTPINTSDGQDSQSLVGDDYDSERLLSPNLCWELSEELDALLKVMLKPLQRFERRAVIKEFPRPASDGAFTPSLDNYLTSMISGAKISNNLLRDIQDKILDVLGPLCSLHENITLMHESLEEDAIT